MNIFRLSIGVFVGYVDIFHNIPVAYYEAPYEMSRLFDCMCFFPYTPVKCRRCVVVTAGCDRKSPCNSL